MTSSSTSVATVLGAFLDPDGAAKAKADRARADRARADETETSIAATTATAATADVAALPANRAQYFEQNDKGWTLAMDVPGLSREQLIVLIRGALVRIVSKPEARRTVRAVYELPGEVDLNASQATLQEGILTLRLSKPVGGVLPING